MASRDEKISLSESNIILQQAAIDPEQAKNYLGFLSAEMASRDEKISLSESNIILQQAPIDPEHAKNYLGFWDIEMIIARDRMRGF